MAMACRLVVFFALVLCAQSTPYGDETNNSDPKSLVQLKRVSEETVDVFWGKCVDSLISDTPVMQISTTSFVKKVDSCSKQIELYKTHIQTMEIEGDDAESSRACELRWQDIRIETMQKIKSYARALELAVNELNDEARKFRVKDVADSIRALHSKVATTEQVDTANTSIKHLEEKIRSVTREIGKLSSYDLRNEIHELKDAPNEVLAIFTKTDPDLEKHRVGKYEYEYQDEFDVQHRRSPYEEGDLLEHIATWNRFDLNLHIILGVLFKTRDDMCAFLKEQNELPLGVEGAAGGQP